jgi:hypothetical protein
VEKQRLQLPEGSGKTLKVIKGRGWIDQRMGVNDGFFEKERHDE